LVTIYAASLPINAPMMLENNNNMKDFFSFLFGKGNNFVVQ